MNSIIVQPMVLVVAVWLIAFCLSEVTLGEETKAAFDPDRDLLSLHFDHAPDKDDGHSAAADRTLLQSRFGKEWLAKHVVAVSGTYGKNAETFDSDSDLVMDAAWKDAGGWLAAHTAREKAFSELVNRWTQVLNAGGDVWVKEGGQSDITAAVVKRIREESFEIDTTERIHVVQHSDWNEEQTTAEALSYVKEHTDYIRIRDANAYLNREGGDEQFVRASLADPTFGKMWKVAYEYYDPEERLDFSDTGELLHILGLGEVGIDEFRNRFLK